MAALNETRNTLHNESAGIASQGLLLKSGGSGVELTDGVTDLAVGVSAAESSRDAAGAFEGSGVGTVAVYPLSGIVYVLAEVKGDGAKFGMPLYADAGGTGYVAWAAADGNSTEVGYYMGEDMNIAAGDIVPVGVV